MSLFKFNFFILLLLSPLSRAEIDGLSCLQSEFSATVSHKGFPFGMTQNILKLSKNNCELTLEHQKLKFMKNKWLIDVCRAPVHIKSGASGEIKVIKKKTNCGTDAKAKNDEFCKTLTLMEQVIQDDGLIFAKGEKENISSEHGKIYCAYVLIRSYLRFDKVLSRTDKQLNFDLENPLKKIVKEVEVELIKKRPVQSDVGTPAENITNDKVIDPSTKEKSVDVIPTNPGVNQMEVKELGTF
jgi:hypothetical protein